MAGDSSARPWAVALWLGLGLAAFETAALVIGYRDLAMTDAWRFRLFYFTGLAALSGLIFGLGAMLVDRGRGRPLTIALGCALSGVVIFGLYYHWLLETGAVSLHHPAARIGGGLALGGVLASGVVGAVLAWTPLGRMRRGLAALAVCALVSAGAFLTRDTTYPEPEHLSGLAGASLESPPLADGADVLLITIDTLRADHLPTYGYPRDTAPALDRLARGGVTMERAITQRSYTGPSLATILTGTYPPTHRVFNNRDAMQDFNVTLGELLQSKGWYTASVVSNPALTRVFNFQQGFDETNRERTPEELAADPKVGSANLNEEAIPVLERLANHDRFFLWIHYVDPHKPYVVPDDYRGTFADDGLSGRHGDHPAPVERAFGDAYRSGDPFYENRQLDFAISQYDAEIRFNDDSIGRVLERLEELGLTDNTLVIVTADHGESLGERNIYFHHGDDNEANLHVPLILSHPALPTGVRIEQPVSLVDLAPTVLDLLGLPPSPTMQGESFAALVLGRKNAPTRRLHYSVANVRTGYQSNTVSSATHKLVFDVNPRWLPFDVLVQRAAKMWLPVQAWNLYRARVVRRELYDLAADPEETHNLAGQGLPVEAELDAALWRWIEAAYYEGRGREVRRGDVSPQMEKALEALGYVE